MTYSNRAYRYSLGTIAGSGGVWEVAVECRRTTEVEAAAATAPVADPDEPAASAA